MKIAKDRKERAQQEVRSKKKKPAQNRKLDEMLGDLSGLKNLDVNDLLNV